MLFLIYRNKAYKRVRLKIAPSANSSQIRKNLEPLEIPPAIQIQGIEGQALLPRLRYLAGELITTARESHKNKDLSLPLYLTMEAAESGLSLHVKDSSGQPLSSAENSPGLARLIGESQYPRVICDQPGLLTIPAALKEGEPPC